MTIGLTARIVEYAGNGSTVTFAVPYKFFAASDLQVVLRTALGVETVKTITTDYSVAGGDGATGSVTFVAPPATGLTVVVRGAMPVQQPDNFTDYIPAATLNRALDRQTIATQEAAGKIADTTARALLARPGQVAALLDAAVNLRGKALFWTSDDLLIGISADSFAITTEIIGYRDQALASANAAGGFAGSASTSATTASTGAATATGAAASALLSANVATLASAIVNAYPNSAGVGGNVPRGLTQASVGAITAGSGGTNGTFALAWSGGNFAINPTGIFTVAGGVVTAVTITGPGLYIGASPTVPTPSFAASSGLSGAAVALTAQFLVANGVAYWAQSADGLQLDRITNVGGTPTAVAGVGPIPINLSTAAISAAIASARAARLIAAVQAASGDASKIKLLVTKDGAKTYRSASTTDIQTLAALIGPTLGQNATTYDGTGGAGLPLRPIETATGIQFHSQVGFDLTTAPLTQTGEYCIDIILRAPAPAASYASAALMNADIAARKMGDISTVTAGARTNIPATHPGYPDPAAIYLRNMEIGDADVIQGLYIKNNGTYAAPTAQPFLSILNVDESKYSKFYFDRLGRIGLFSYDGTAQVLANTQNTDAFTLAQSGPLHLKIDVSHRHTRLWLNGVEIYSVASKTSFTPHHMYFNGAFRYVASIPVNGFDWTMDALCISENLDFTQKRNVSDALAAAFGTPQQPWNPVVRLGLHIGQSNGAGSTNTAGDANRPDAISGWNGMITAAGADAPASVAITNTFLPRVFVVRDANAPWDIGPLRATTNVFSLPAGVGNAYVVGGQGIETVEWGLRGQLFTTEDNRNHDWCLIGLNDGAYGLGYLDTSTNPYLYGIRSAVFGTWPTITNERDHANRMVAEAVAFFASRGQTVELVYCYHEQGETIVPLPAGYTQATYGAAYEASWRNWLVNQLWHLVNPTGPAPLYIKKAINGSGNGVDNSYNVTPYYYDDQLRRLEATRDMTFRFAFLGEAYGRDGRFIHKPLQWHRKRGESLGQLILDAQAGNETACFQVSSVSIVGGKIRLFLTEAADVVDTAYPTVLARHTTGGVDTFGLVLEVTGKTIASVDNSHAGDATTPYIEVTGSASFAAGTGRINVTGTAARWSNYRRKRRTYGLLPDQDWSGSPGNFTSGAPPYTPGSVNETTPWLAAGSYPL